MRRLILPAIVFTCLIFGLPAQARAQGYFAPFAGFDFGGDAGNCAGVTSVTTSGCVNRTVYGFSAGALSHGLFGGEIDFGYAPHFFGDTPTIGGNSVLTFMGNMIVAVPAGPVHPYVAGGLGIIRTKVDQIEDVVNFSDSSFAYNLGGGLMVMLPSHLGFRVDYRHMRSSNDLSLAGIHVIEGSTLNYNRIAFALVLH
jgi:opacity protein-like surface antigen